MMINEIIMRIEVPYRFTWPRETVEGRYARPRRSWRIRLCGYAMCRSDCTALANLGKCRSLPMTFSASALTPDSIPHKNTRARTRSVATARAMLPGGGGRRSIAMLNWPKCQERRIGAAPRAVHSIERPNAPVGRRQFRCGSCPYCRRPRGPTLFIVVGIQSLPVLVAPRLRPLDAYL